jgi:hypothetical protein
MTREEIYYSTGATLTNVSSIINKIGDIEHLFNFGNTPSVEQVKAHSKWILDRLEDIRNHQNTIRENFKVK